MKKKKLNPNDICPVCNKNTLMVMNKTSKTGKVFTSVQKTCKNCRNKKQISNKKCKICGRTDNLQENNLGVLNICKKHYSEKLSKGKINLLLSNPLYRTKIGEGVRRHNSLLTPEQKELEFKRKSKLMIDIHNNGNIDYKKRGKLWSKSWNNKTEEEKQKYADNLKEVWANKTEEEMKKYSEKIKSALAKRSLDAIKLQHERIQNKRWSSKESSDRIRENISKGVCERLAKDDSYMKIVNMKNKAYWNNLSEEELKHGQKAKDRWNSFSFEKKIDIIERSLKNRIYSKVNNRFVSKAQIKCYEYVLENIDPDAVLNKRYVDLNNKFIVYVDIYLPKHDLYVEYDSKFWHGKNINTQKAFFKLRNGGYERIIRTMKRDRKQNKIMNNLIRIDEDDFYKNKEIVKDKIQKYLE